MRTDAVTTSWDEVPVVVDMHYVARLFRLSEERVRQMCVSGDIPAFKIGGMWRVSKQALMRLCGIDEK